MSIPKHYTWHKIADSLQELEFSANGFSTIKVAGKNVCIALHKELLYACAAKCPHAGGSMAGGYIDALGNIVCPLHRYKFNLQNGRNVTGEGYFLKTWPVENREDGIYIGIEKTSFY